MNLSTILEPLMTNLGGSLPTLLGALAVLLLGWLLAIVVRFACRRGLALAGLNRRLRASTGSEMDLEGGAAMGAFWVVMVLAFIAFFNTLDLALVSQPLAAMMEQVLTFLPRLLGAAVLGLVAWLIATILRMLVTKALVASGLDEKLSSEAEVRPLSQSLGHVVYGLTLLLFLPAVLGALELDGLLLPVQNMVNEALGILPNLAAAVVLGLVGWVVARLLKNLVTNLLGATGIDRFGHRAGLKDTMSLSALIGIVTFVFVFVPALIAALDALGIEAVSAPATRMLEMMMGALPGLFAAALIVIVAWFISEFLAGLAGSVLEGIGANRIPSKLGIPRLLPEDLTVSVVSGRAIQVLVLLFAGVEAAKVLGFARISELAALLIQFSGQVLLGTFIIGLGLWIANLAYDAIARVSRAEVSQLAGLARFTILALVLAMGLKAMGIADAIVTLAFALPLGAVALAFALSFGLGGRKVAARHMEEWLSRFGEKK